MERTYRILVVDDHSEIRELLKRFLTQHGLSVVTAADGDAMEKCMNQYTFDLIILDLMLPGKDGVTLCREVRARSNIPIIMLTALGEEIALWVWKSGQMIMLLSHSIRVSCWPGLNRCSGAILLFPVCKSR